MKSLRLLLLSAVSVLAFSVSVALGASGLKDLSLLGTNPVLSGATFSIESGATFTYKTGASFGGDAAEFRADIGLGAVQNYSAAALPISTATQAALDLKAPLASPTFTGTVSGITKAMVGLGNVANVDTTNAANIASGTLPAGRLPALTGDATSTAGAAALTLATVNTNTGSWGSATQAPVITLNGKGLATAASNVTITPAWTSVSGKPTTVGTSGLTDAVATSRTISTTAPLTGGGDLTANRTLAVSTATTGATGVVQLATSAELLAGTDTAKAATAAGVNDRVLLGDVGVQNADMLSFDGATSGARIYTPGGAVAAVGTGDFCVAIASVEIPVANPTEDNGIFALTAINSGYTNPAGAPWPLLCSVGPNGRFYFRIGSDANNTNRISSTSMVTSLGGRAVPLVVQRVGGVLTAYISGVAVAVGDTPTGSGPLFSEAVLTDFVLQGCLWSLTRFKGRMSPLYFINGSLSATEIFNHAQTRRLPQWCDNGTGSMVPKYTGDFSSTVDSWIQNIADANLVLTGNVDGVSGVDNVLGVQASGGAKGCAIRHSASDCVIGQKFRLTFDYYADTGAFSGSPFIGVGVSSNRFDTAGGVPVVEGSWQTGKEIEFVQGNASALLSICFAVFTTSTGGTVTNLQTAKNVYLKNVSLRTLGPIFKPIVQPIGIIGDAGTNKLCGVLTAGVTPITNKRDWSMTFTTSTSGNQQIAGASTFMNALTNRIDSWVINNAGTSKTVSLGNTSAGTQYASGITTAAGLTDVTLLTRFNATTNLWVNSNGTDVLTHTITGHKVD